LPPEIEEILRNLMKLLENDDEQNNMLPEPHRSKIVGIAPEPEYLLFC
jgi:hypothetical protein